VSKILKRDLRDLPKHLSKLEIPEPLTPETLSQSIIPDLIVTDIRPICAFLKNHYNNDDWNLMEPISSCLEKNTQGKVLTGLKVDDTRIFSDILEKGISVFDEEGYFLVV
jgi:hypothetical protein